MDILYDFQILIGQQYGGVSRYFHALQNRLEKKPGVRITLPRVFSRNYYFDPLLSKCTSLLYDKASFYDTALAMNINKTTKIIQRGSYDIIHPTYYHPYVLSIYNRSKLVITVYDMIHETYHKKCFIDDLKTIHHKKKMIEHADIIIAISQSTKTDIMRFYPHIPQEKIKVVHLATSFKKANTRQKLNLPSDYILFVGNRGGYKNYARLIKAMTPLLKSDKNCNIVCAGGGSLTNDEVSYLVKNKIRSQVFQMNVSDEMLQQLYLQALCFVFPSEYEGFGIPILESFSQDCPAVLSNSSSLSEVGGNAALYFDPTDTNDIQNKMNELIYNPSLRAKLRKAGRLRSKAFSWEKVAEQTLDIYRDVLK